MGKFKRINVTISEEANNILVGYQTSKGFSSKDEALDDILLEFGKWKENGKK